MTLRYEKNKFKEGYQYIIGCDEVGRGSLAGPVVAASVILDLACLPARQGFKISDLKNIKDSKLLSPSQRQTTAAIIKGNSLWSIGVVSQNIIDNINIHNATLLAMRRSVEGLLNSVIPSEERSDESRNPLNAELSKGKEFLHAHSDALALGRDDKKEMLVAIDGRFVIPDINISQEPIINGDNNVLSIAAASIIAKVYRDQLMTEYHQNYPIYNFAQHKGYGTFHHRKMILQHGLSPLHRLSFCHRLSVAPLKIRGVRGVMNA